MSSNNIKEEKKNIRNIILFKRRGMALEDWERDSALIVNKLLNHRWYKEASSVLVFINQDNEPRLNGVILHALANRKKVYAPVVDLNSKEMEYYRLRNYGDLKPGAYGILEPPATDNDRIDLKEEQGVMLVPGAVFDRFGHRIGYGGGYYDKYLNRLDKNSFHTIAPMFSFQLEDVIPFESHDLAVDCMITEKGVIEIRP